MSVLSELEKLARRLSSEKIKLLTQFAVRLETNVEATYNENSDFITPEFADAFGARLLLYHSFHEQKMTKKSFEYAFRGAAISCGMEAFIVSSQTNPGEDLILNGQPLSLKTEGAKGMSKSKIKISKLMEARWIRECQSPSDFCNYSKSRIVSHLSSYEKIVMLRAFDPTIGYFKYDLVEIPVATLREISNLTAEDFSPPYPKSGGSVAKVSKSGKTIFSLRLDGSVEKVSILSLSTDACMLHCSWKVPQILDR